MNIFKKLFRTNTRIDNIDKIINKSREQLLNADLMIEEKELEIGWLLLSKKMLDKRILRLTKEKEKMSAEDLAQEAELRQWNINNAPRKNVSYLPESDGYGPEFCKSEDCCTEMPKERREHGYTICVLCQEKKEARSKLRTRR